jgi:hypothetical protein
VEATILREVIPRITAAKVGRVGMEEIVVDVTTGWVYAALEL